ncbi:MAG: hypothetical protein AAFY70_11875 [Bacteroidota bacterium]
MNTLFFGAKGAKVKVIQTYLNQFSLPAPLVVDGDWGAKTDEALQLIEHTDRVDSTLYAKMVQSVNESLSKSEPTYESRSSKKPVVRYVIIGGTIITLLGTILYFVGAKRSEK